MYTTSRCSNRATERVALRSLQSLGEPLERRFWSSPASNPGTVTSELSCRQRVPNEVPDSAEVTLDQRHLEPRTWLYRAESASSGTTTEPKVRGSNPLGRASNPLETAGFRVDCGVPKKVPNFASGFGLRLSRRFGAAARSAPVRRVDSGMVEGACEEPDTPCAADRPRSCSSTCRAPSASSAGGCR